MESYIEVTYGVNAIILILCTMTSDMLFQYPASVMRIVGISLCFTLVLMIIDDQWLYLLLSELCYGILVVRKFHPAILLALAFRIITILSLRMAFGGAVIGCIWYLPIQKSNLIWVFLCLFIGYLLWMPRWNLYARKFYYRYPVTIYFGDLVIQGLGYLDSGNSASFQGQPIVFMNKTEFIKIQEKGEQRIVKIRTVQGSTMMSCYNANIMIDRNPKQQVLIGEMDQVKQGFDVLLNVRLFQVR